MEILPSPLVWGIFTRLLGAVWLIAFASLWTQVLAIAGRKGMTPVHLLLDAYRRDYPDWRRFAYLPTLLWVSTSDRMLRGLVGVGILASILIVVGGPWTPLLFGVCWICWLSLDAAIELGYPWDNLLFEAGFVALWLPPALLLPEFGAEAAPLPIVAFGFHFLLARVMLGFGKIKFTGTTRKDRGYLREFLINQPIPQPVGWFASRAPGALLAGGIYFLAVVELILPLLLFVPGWPRLVAALGIGAVMVGIQVTSNFGYFNLLTLVLCVAALDLGAGVQEMSAADVVGDPLTHAAIAFWALLGLINFPFNSWCTRSWPHWPLWEGVHSRPIRALVGLARAAGPWRISGAYGVFPPQTIPGVKFAPVIEASRDGEEWREYRYHYFPTTERSRPRWVAPHHPRLDHFVLYDGLGHHFSGFMASLVSTPHPYHACPVAPMDRLLQRLMEGNSPVLQFFREDPFADGAPPRMARVTLKMLEPTDSAEALRTGRWWTRTSLGEHYPVRERDDRLWERWPGDPLLFHWDNYVYKRRVGSVRDFLAEARAAEDVDGIERAAEKLLALLGRPKEAVHRFWSELIPAARTESFDWTSLPATVERLRARFTAEEVVDFLRVSNALAMALDERYRWRVFGASDDYLPLQSYFDVGALCCSIMLDGREAYGRALADDAWLVEQAAGLSESRELWLWGVLRFDMMQYHARRGRLSEAMSPTPFQPGLPGFARLSSWVGRQLWDPTTERLPLFTRDIQDGRWRLSGWLGGEGKPEAWREPAAAATATAGDRA